MVNELIAEGVTGERLVRVVQELTGLPEIDALQLIAIETGKSEGDVVRFDTDEWPWGKNPSELG